MILRNIRGTFEEMRARIRWWEGVVDGVEKEATTFWFVAPLGLNLILRSSRWWWGRMKYYHANVHVVRLYNPPETNRKLKDIIDETHKHLKEGDEWKP